MLHVQKYEIDTSITYNLAETGRIEFKNRVSDFQIPGLEHPFEIWCGQNIFPVPDARIMILSATSTHQCMHKINLIVYGPVPDRVLVSARTKEYCNRTPRLNVEER